jgi:hypothetical protein
LGDRTRGRQTMPRFPEQNSPLIERMVERCRETIQASSGRERLIDCEEESIVGYR